MSTLAVRNEAQRILLETEILGQLSDGRWENTYPMNHWCSWRDASIIVDPANVGRDFHPSRDDYRLDLLADGIGERMVAKVEGHGIPYHREQLLRDLRDLKVIFSTERGRG